MKLSNVRSKNGAPDERNQIAATSATSTRTVKLNSIRFTLGTARPNSTRPTVSSIITASTGNAYWSAHTTLSPTSVWMPSHIGSIENGSPTGQAVNVWLRMRSAS